MKMDKELKEKVYKKYMNKLGIIKEDKVLYEREINKEEKEIEINKVMKMFME